MPSPNFTWQEVAEHNKPNDIYVSINGKVYDVTKFAPKHPGGIDQLLLGAGRDVSIVFDSYHKPETHKLLEKYYVGDLEKPELPYFRPPSEFHKTLRQRVAAYFRETQQDPKWAPWMFVRYLLIVGTLVGLKPMHDCSHYSITHSPTVWKMVGSLHDLLNGASLRVWSYQHMLGHHPYTNIDNVDPDIMTSEKDIRRIKTSQNWFWRYLGQHIYAPILYSMLAVKTRVQDVVIAFVVKRNGSIRVNEFPAVDKAIFFVGKALFLLTRFVVPMFFMSVSQTLVLYAIQDAVSSWWLALCFQASHVVGEVDWPVANKDNFVDQDWAELQINTTMDYATDSWWCNVFTGGLNHQTTHHLFPGVCQYFYPQITPIVVKTCKEFGIQYHYKETFTEALGAHINHLRVMGREPETKKGL